MKIHVIEPLAIGSDKTAEIRETLNAEGHEVVFFNDRKTDPYEVIRRSEGADVVVIANLPFPEVCVNTLPDLKMLAVAFTGVDHVALQACRDRGIRVCNASGYSTVNVAELTIGLIIDVLRNITRLDAVTRAGGTKDGLVGRDLAGKTVGIIGMGAIGRRVAGILKAFGCTVTAVKREGSSGHNVDGVQYLTFDELLAGADIVSLHCPLNESTRGMIGARELSLMKKSSILINTSRGPVVQAGALVQTLKEGTIGGAGIDVFDSEPPLSPDLPLFGLPNAVVTPHIAFATTEAFIRRADIVVDNILSWIGGSPKNVIL